MFIVDSNVSLKVCWNITYTRSISPPLLQWIMILLSFNQCDAPVCTVWIKMLDWNCVETSQACNLSCSVWIMIPFSCTKCDDIAMWPLTSVNSNVSLKLCWNITYAKKHKIMIIFSFNQCDEISVWPVLIQMLVWNSVETSHIQETSHVRFGCELCNYETVIKIKTI